MRAAALAACEFAASHTNFQHPLVREALEKLRKGPATLSATQQSELEALVETLDNEYFDLQEADHEGRASTGDYLQKFAQARAVSAVLFAFKDDAYEASTQSVYEAAAALKDKNPLFSVVEATLP